MTIPQKYPALSRKKRNFAVKEEAYKRIRVLHEGEPLTDEELWTDGYLMGQQDISQNIKGWLARYCGL